MFCTLILFLCHRTGVATSARMLMGDFNAFPREDPIDIILAGGYSSAIDFSDKDAYTYVFAGQWGLLDYIFHTPSLLLADAATWKVNADEPSLFDYNTDFGNNHQFDASDPYRYSDHDPVIATFQIA